MVPSGQGLSANEARKRLINAATAGDLDEIRRILELREDAVHLRNSHHNTALRSAVAAGQLEAAKLLVEHGADVHQVNHGGSSLMESAAMTGHRDMVRWLAHNGLQIGVIELSAIGDLDAVRSIVKSDPSCLRLRDRRGLSALHHAAHCGRVDVIKHLVDLGADIRATNRHGHEPLSIAVEANQIEAVVCLLKEGADPNAQGGHYQGTVLHRAVLHRSLLVVDALLGAGADPNRRDANGKTPLHDAIGLGNRKVAARLLESPNIDTSLRSGKTKFSALGETPLEYARNRGKQGLLKLLEEHAHSD